MSKFKPGVYFKDGKQVFLNDKGEVVPIKKTTGNYLQQIN